jgi:hypothetical protein
MAYDTLRYYALNIKEAARNPGLTSDNNDNEDQGNSSNLNKKAENRPHPQEEQSYGRKHLWNYGSYRAEMPEEKKSSVGSQIISQGTQRKGMDS